VETIRERVAGLDVHRDRVVACCRLVVKRRVKMVKQSFSTMSAGVAELGAWLVENGVTTAVMESTGKRVPGRKTDMSDSEWLADVAAHGMVRPSFVPPPRSVSCGS
jgi:hypothetical protein